MYADLLPKFKPVAGIEVADRPPAREGQQLPDGSTRTSGPCSRCRRASTSTSRVIVWIVGRDGAGDALRPDAPVPPLGALPVRILQRGVRHVARGSFDYKIDLKSGDEMQDLAEAFNDMTAQISLTYADLERQVQERSRQLVRSERLAGVGFLAAGVAHEINNPLASIAFCAEALDHRLGAVPGRCQRPRLRDGRQLSEDDPGRGVPLQEHHREAAGLLPLQRHHTASGPTWPA